MQEGKLWKSLSEEQKQEVFQAFVESEDENRLIDSELVFGKSLENEPIKIIPVISTPGEISSSL